MTVFPHSRYFPPAEAADPEGLIAIGGELKPDWLLDAYRHGIFPWPVDRVLAWWSPDPRGVLEFDDLHVSRRLARTCRSARFSITRDRDFAGVIDGCATSHARSGGTWITAEMQAAYCRLHEVGHAHSVEAWEGEALVGGVYGVSIGRSFAAESMFHSVRDASKVALVHLVRHLQSRGFQLLDIQQLTPHTERLGATEIRREDFLKRLADAINADAIFG